LPKRKSGREPTGQDPVPSSKLWIIRKAHGRSNRPKARVQAMQALQLGWFRL